MLNRCRFVLIVAVLLLMVLPMSLFAQDTETDAGMDRDAMIAVWERFDKELWQGWNYDIVDEVLADDFTMYSWGYPPQNREDYVQYWIMGSNSWAPAYTMEHHILLVDGDYLVVDDNWGGIFENEFNGQPPTGEMVRVNGVEIFHFADDKITEAWVLYDATPFMLQMGFMPTEDEVLPDVAWDIALGETSTSPEENKVMVAGLVEKINAHDVPGFFAGFADDAVIHDMDADLTVDEAVDMMLDIQTNFPDHQATDITYFAEGDLVVYMFTLTFIEDQVVIGGLNVDRIEDGKIVEEWWLYDAFGMSQQMAAMEDAES